MSNGRRRWRKWMKIWRSNMRRAGAVPFHPRTVAVQRRHAEPLTESPQPSPWSPRSLVGMSMGARKRMAHRARTAAINLLAGFGKQADPVKLAMLRSLYRIGERLRPCSGCVGCAYRCGHEYDCFCDLQEPPNTDCNDTGLLPARKAKR